MTERDASLLKMRSFWEEWFGRRPTVDGVSGFDRWRTRNVAAIADGVAVLERKTRLAHDQRQRLIAYAASLQPILDRARKELREDFKTQGITNLAKWLNDNEVPPPRVGASVGEAKAAKWHKASVASSIFQIDRLIAREAVMETRARMSALAMSADFRFRSNGEHERACIDIIEQGIRTRMRLANDPADTDDNIRHSAIMLARDEAEQQRMEYIPLRGRTCYLIDAPFDDAIFEIETI